MRTRKEIEKDMRTDDAARQPHPLEADVLMAILETLLDVRDLLIELEKRA